MRTNALGLVEVRGYLGAIAAADAALKAASVTCIGLEMIKSGLVTVKITGDVGAVQAAVEAGAETAEQLKVLLTRHVIARLHEETKAIVMKKEGENEQAEEQPAAGAANSGNADKADEANEANEASTADANESQTKAGEADVPADAEKKAANTLTAAANETAAAAQPEPATAAQPEPATANPGSSPAGLPGSKDDTSGSPAQGAKKQTTEVKVVDLPAAPVKEQAGSTGTSPGTKSKKPASKETKRIRKTKKAGS
ncbi:BMC domain-containing protein [Paenibacillus larvae]